MTRLMVKVSILMQMVLITTVSGKMINSMALELKNGLMVQFMKATISRGKRMDLES